MLLAMVLSACGSEKSSGGGNVAVDHAKPESVVNAIFAAAKSGDDSKLAGLCDPTGDNDGDTRDICNAKKGSKDWAEFEKYFAKGAVKGSPRIDPETAVVDFTFGPDGKMQETMNLVKRDGKWYLSSF